MNRNSEPHTINKMRTFVTMEQSTSGSFSFVIPNRVELRQGNILEVSFIEPESIDLIVTSPPYNLEVEYDSYQDNLDYDEYLEFSRKWLSRCFDFLRADGRLCLNIPMDSKKNGHRSVGADITTIAKQVGFRYHTTIIWNKGNVSKRTAWGSWKSASAPEVTAPVELIIVFYKKQWKKESGSKESDITRDEFIAWTNGLWSFGGESKKRIGHPAPFPIELPKRCIKLFSYVGDTVLDPFAGSGTTLIAAADLRRYAVGVEIDSTYCEIAKRRILSSMNAKPDQHVPTIF